MKRERILVMILILTAVTSLLFTSLVTAATLADEPSQKEPDHPTQPSMAAAIVMTKTVATDPTNCNLQKTIVVAPGTEVVYCYEVQNIGDVTLDTHDLEDSELGTILDQFSFVLVPGSTAFLTSSAVIDTSTINTATWTASDGTPANTVTYTDGATVIATSLNTCRFPNIAIPDNSITGTTSSMYLNGIGTIEDLDVYLETDHTWVGDLRFTLEHVDTGTTAELIDRVGAPATTFGCQSDNIRAIIDDEAEIDAETSCGPPNLALANRYVGGDPADNNLLSVFDGEDLSGEWQLHVTDNASGDVGNLESWCLLPALLAPDISVVPDALSSSQPPSTQTEHTLSIRNSGNAPLSWTIYEAYDEPAAQRARLPFIMPATGPSQQPLLAPLLAADKVSNDPVSANAHLPQTLASGPQATPPIDVLYDNGPLVNMPDGGSGGADASVVQNLSLNMTLYGFAHQIDFGNSVADDFTVTDPNGWYVDEITFYAYQTGSGTDSTITAVGYRLWDGPPDEPGSNILIYPGMPNQLVESNWSGIYRVAEDGLDATNRPVMQNSVAGGFVLQPGTYWLEWQTDGTNLLSGPWAPPVTISNVITTGNALQYMNNSWQSIIDVGPQDLPFVISGFALEDIPWATVDPTSGTLPSGTTEVMVTFDSSGLGLGTYTGNLLVASNDPYKPVVAVPLTLTVELAYLYLPYVIK